MTSPARLRRLGIATVGAALAATLSAPLASAHDVVTSANPKDGSTVGAFPEEISLEFSAQPRDGFNTFAVTNTDTQEVVFSGEPTIDGRVLSLDVPEGTNPGPGDYTIGYRITSSDGHATQGTSTFTVSAESATTESAKNEDAAKQESAETERSAGLTWIIAIGAVLAVAAAAVAAIMRSRNSRAK
ncbi:copper resistance CopC family protein [Corynebacterium tapiri]|uniref:Copper resistance protein CopC n=1 Tax=Corynebacterium tapiri TaxID=1448266 RepID=A0A5C4U4R9_9CORY|nr:copper resistance CopC family protein [Corynebacterium tapiri]TNL97734.1 copper resistance protein CopC [Corynebacterium tapiri]